MGACNAFHVTVNIKKILLPGHNKIITTPQSTYASLEVNWLGIDKAKVKESTHPLSCLIEQLFFMHFVVNPQMEIFNLGFPLYNR